MNIYRTIAMPLLGTLLCALLLSGGCSSEKSFNESDAGDTDTGSDLCDNPDEGVGFECTPGGDECVCDNMCGADLFEEAGDATGFTCLAECSEELPCHVDSQVCVQATLDDDTGACIPTGSIPLTEFTTYVMTSDSPQKNSDILGVDTVVDIDGIPWTVTWVVAVDVPDDGEGNEVVYIVFGGSPTGVVYRQLYVVVPREDFVPGTMEQVNPDSTGPADYFNFDVVIQDSIYGDGFESPPTELRYVAGALDGTLVLDSVGAECADSEPGDCEVTIGSIEGNVLVWNLIFPTPEQE